MSLISPRTHRRVCVRSACSPAARRGCVDRTNHSGTSHKRHCAVRRKRRPVAQSRSMRARRRSSAAPSVMIRACVISRTSTRSSYAIKKGNGLTMGATSTVVIYIVAGGIVSVVGMLLSACVFSFLVLPRVARHASPARFRFWTPWFFASLSVRETRGSKRKHS
jgi:hypothetical protein